MSLIQFRRHPILPPLVKEPKPLADEQSKEDNSLLSLPPDEALKYILSGFPNLSEYHSAKLSQLTNCKEPAFDHSVKFNIPPSQKANHRVGSRSLVNETIDPHLTTEKSAKIIAPNSSNINDKQDPLKLKNNKGNDTIKVWDKKNSCFNEKLIEAPKFINSCSNHFPIDKENVVYQEQRGEVWGSPSVEENSALRTDNLDLQTKASQDKHIVSGVTNHQKLKALKSSGTNSSAYLHDYLQLLTSRSHFTNVGKTKKGNEAISDHSLERSGSAPVLCTKKNSPPTRQRNASGNSDKSNVRSLGSTYLDGYLGNLTDHSWIIYPTADTVTDPSLKLDSKEKSPETLLTLSPGTKNGELMHRKLHFINPEKFFNSLSEKKESSESHSYHTTIVNKSISSTDNDQELGLTDTSGIVVSPDMSASSLDTDKLDSSHAFSTSLQETPAFEECQLTKEDLGNKSVLQDCRLSHINEGSSETQLHMDGSSMLSSELPSSLNETGKNEIKVSSTCYLKERGTQDKTKQPQDVLSMEDLEFQEQEEILNSEESSVTSTDDADQVSMIVRNTQNASGVDSNREYANPIYDISDHSKTSDSIESCGKIPKNKSNEESLFPKPNSCEIFNDFSGVDNSISKLINMMRQKHDEELQKLRNQHLQEMNNFVYQLLQLSATQRLTLANNGSLNDVFNNLPDTTLLPSVSSESVISTTADSQQDSLTSPYKHTNLMPSFFLHEDKRDVDAEKRTDVNKISQIFSPLRINFHDSKKSSGELVTFDQTVMKKSQEDNSGNRSERCLLPKENAEDASELRKQTTFMQRQFEVGLDLVPTRESDGVTVNLMVMNSKQNKAIAKLQGIIKGRRIRNLMRTSQVQQLLATLKEVAKLAHQFHHDILMDNIRKGDVDFHKALFNQEKQTREKFIDIMVEMSPRDQIRMIQKDQDAGKREQHPKRVIGRPKGSKALPAHESGSMNRNISVCVRSEGSIEKGDMKPGLKKPFSELPRPCKTTQSCDSKFSKPLAGAGRGTRLTLLSAPRAASTRTIPRRVLKKIEPNPQPHLTHRRQNSPICKSEPSCLGIMGAKAAKGDRTNVNIRGDLVPSRKPWR